MFHYEEKLKDLKVELQDDTYKIQYMKDTAEEEFAIFHIQDEKPARVSLGVPGQNLEVGSDGLKQIYVGRTGNTLRDVTHFSIPDSILPTLRCGFTSHIGDSTWSSTPHPFEHESPEVLPGGFEEVFLYLLSGGTWMDGAIQRGFGVWQDKEMVNEVWAINDRDISAIPMGYHPVVGEPGVHVSYIWAYLAKKKEWEKI